MTAPAVAAERHLALTTFPRWGEAVSCPVLVVALEDGRLGCWTATGTGAIASLRHAPAVEVRACDRRGRVRADAPAWVGTAVPVRSGRAFAEVQGKVRAKYGLRVAATRLLARLGPHVRGVRTYAETVVLITLD